MTDNQKIIGTSILALGVLLLLKTRQYVTKQSAIQVIPNGAGDQAKFALPYLTTNPGIPDTQRYLNGGPTFQSMINLNLNPALGMQLGRVYIPLFGFVGVQTIGEANQLQPVTIH